MPYLEIRALYDIISRAERKVRLNKGLKKIYRQAKKGDAAS